MRKIIVMLLMLAVLSSSTASAEISKLLPYAGDEVAIDIYMGFSQYDDTKPLFEDIMKAFGNIKFNFELTSTEDRETKRNLYLATGTIPDIMLCQGLEDIMTNYGQDGEDMFLNFKEYEEYMPNWVANRQADESQKQFDIDENTAYYVLPVVANYASEGWMVNKTRLDEYGLAIPTTFDEMVACMETIEKAKPESTQLAGYTCWGVDYWRGLVGNLIGNESRSATGCYRDEETGEYYLYAQTDMFKQTVELLADWYAKGYFHPDDFNMSEEEMISKVWAQNDWTFACTYQSSPEQFTNKWKNDLPIEVVVIKPLAKEGVTPVVRADYRNDGYYWAYCASAQTEHPELVASIIDMMVSDEYSALWFWGVEGLTYEVSESGKKQFINEYTEAAARLEYGIQSTLPDANISRNDMDARAAAWPDRVVAAHRANSTWLNNGEATYYYYTGPNFTADEAEEFAAIFTPIQTYINENLSLFVYGQRSLDEWDNFLAEMQNYGDIEKLLELCTNAEQRTFASAEERTYWVPAE
jgi:putative aldouronate transport system substrate-binding protein